MGMVDGIGTFEDVIERLASGNVGKRGARAEDETVQIAAQEARDFWRREQYE